MIHFEGIVLAYEFNILDNEAKILPRLKAKLLLYSPKPDMLVEGKVVKVKQESIHVIILGFSSAVIQTKIFVKNFDINLVDEETLYIYGSLLPAHTGNIPWLDTQMDGSAKRRNGNDGESVLQEPSRTRAETVSVNDDHHVKKSKKHKTREES